MMMQPAMGQEAAGGGCQFTRPELEKLLADSGFGSNQMMFNAYFRANPMGGPPLCAGCNQPIGQHGAAPAATVVVQNLPGGIDVNAPPAGLTPVANDPMIERTPDSETKMNIWWIMLLHPGMIIMLFTCHKTHMEFRHKTREAAYVKEYTCCPNTETSLPYDQIPVPEVDVTSGKHGARFAKIRVKGPGVVCCDPECGHWHLSDTDPYDPAKQEAHKTMWTNYIVRSHQQYAPGAMPVPAMPAGPSAGALPFGQMMMPGPDEPQQPQQAWQGDAAGTGADSGAGADGAFRV